MKAPISATTTIVVFAALLFSGATPLADAHQSGCHGAHSCPSDHHTYVWYDSNGQDWDCAKPGATEYDPVLDTSTITYGGYTYYCRSTGSGPPPSTTKEQLSYSTLSPTDGAGYIRTTSSVAWKITGGPHDIGPYGTMGIRVSTTSATGADGQTLSDAGMVDDFGMTESISEPGTWQGYSSSGSGSWPNNPGTYYWQAEAIWPEYSADFTSYTIHDAITPIYHIVIKPPPPPRDTTPPKVSAFGEARQSLVSQHGIKLDFRCSEACKMKATGFVLIGKSPTKHALGAVGGNLNRSALKTMTLSAGKSLRGAVSKALKNGKQVTAYVDPSGADQAGNKSRPIRYVVNVKP